MLDGSERLRDGTKRLRVVSGTELEDCAAVVVAATENGTDSYFVTYAIQKDGAWKLILPAGGYHRGQSDADYLWSDERLERLERLSQWAYETAGVK
jgi:hypothetical protein